VSRPPFLVLEGGEAAGKSTQIDAVAAALHGAGWDVTITREPGGTSIGRRIRDVLLDPSSDPMDPRTEALLYAADRAQHVSEVIRPALEAGRAVVSDRFVDSSLAYQGIARGLGVDEIFDISAWATGHLLPDLVVYLDLSPAAAFERMGRGLDRIENQGVEFHSGVRDAYLEIASNYPQRFEVVDASGDPSQVRERVVDVLLQRRILSR
jgi:dTMP kinase